MIGTHFSLLIVRNLQFVFALAVEAALPAKEVPSSENVDGFFDEEEVEVKRHPSVGASAKKLPGGGMGFGNLINANILAEKKLKKVHHDVKGEKKAKPEEKGSVTSAEPSKPSTTKTKAPALVKKHFLSFSVLLLKDSFIFVIL